MCSADVQTAYQQSGAQIPFFYPSVTPSLNVGLSQPPAPQAPPQPYISAITLPSGAGAAEMDALPPAPSGMRHADDRPLAMSQMDLIDDALPAYQHELPADAPLLVSLPAETQDSRSEPRSEAATYDYLAELTNTYASLSPEGVPAVLRLKRHNCVVWDFPVGEKKTAKLRVGLQEGQLFLALDDVLGAICGIPLSRDKLAALVKPLVPVGAMPRGSG